MAFGLPREVGLLGFSKELLVAGEFFTLDDSNQAVIAAGLLKPLGFESPAAAIGKPITLKLGGLVEKDQKQFEYETEEVSMEVVGVFHPPRLTSLTNESVLLPVEAMRSLPKHWMEEGLKQLRETQGQQIQGYSSVVVRANTAMEVMDIEKDLREQGFHTYSVIDRMDEMKRFFVFMQVLLTAVGTVALVVSGVGILNTLTMTVMERYQEIGIYKSIGASHGDIRWMFLVEAAAVGLFGGLAGLVLARVVSHFLGWAFNNYAAEYGLDVPDAVLVFPTWLLVGAVLYSVVINVLSGIYPAGKAANIDPVQALRRG